MVLTKRQVEGLPDGTVLRVFMAGSRWEEDFGKVKKVIKLKDKLYNITDFFDTDEIEDGDPGWEIVVAIGAEDNVRNNF